MDDVRSCLQKMSEIEVSLLNRSLLSQVSAGVEKCKLLNSSIASMQVLVGKIAELHKRRLARLSQMLLSCDASRLGARIHLKCLNSLCLTWESAMVTLCDSLCDGSHLQGPLSVSNIISCGQLLRSTSAMRVSQLLNHLQISADVNAATHMHAAKGLPVLLVADTGNVKVLVNLHELDSSNITLLQSY